MIKNRFLHWYEWRVRQRFFFKIAYFINWYYGDAVCWARLVIWVMYDTSYEQLEYAFWVQDCKNDIESFLGSSCYCGKIGGYVPNISPKFMLTGKP